MKRFIRENLFWFCIGASVLLLLVLGILFILPAISDKNELREKVANQKQMLDTIISRAGNYSSGKIDEVKDKRGKLIADYNNVVDFYAEYDRGLECWFEGLQNSPDVGSFDVKYKDHKNKLDAKLREKKLVQGGANPLNWDERLGDNTNTAILKKVQKKYWIRERVVNVLSQSKDKGLGIKFLKGISFRETSEYSLPDDLGETITFEIYVDILYSDILKFMECLISPDNLEPKMLIKIRNCKISMTEPMHEQMTLEYDQKEPAIEPNPMTLILTCEVIDFDASKRKDFK